jgi:peptide/nickel transport system permease protein
MGVSTGLSVLIALPIGIFSAIRKYSVLDYLVTTLSFFGVSMPTFWFGLMLMVIFAVDLHWLPTSGVATPGLENDPLDRLRRPGLPAAQRLADRLSRPGHLPGGPGRQLGR